VNGGKVLILALNRILDTILAELKTEYKNQRITFFRGKENLWPHTKNLGFLRCSYSQPRAKLVRLTASGIYEFWKYWLRERKYLESEVKEENLDSPDPLGLE